MAWMAHQIGHVISGVFLIFAGWWMRGAQQKKRGGTRD